MSKRAYWTGQIRLSLVSLPIRLHPALRSSRSIALHKIHAPTGERVHYQNVINEDEPVERDEIVRGYEYEKGHYVILDEEEIRNLKLESKKTIDIVQFVDASDIDALYYDTPYFVMPEGEVAEEAYQVIRDALKETKKIGLGQLTLGGKERLIALKPCGKGLIIETLRYAYEVAQASTFFDEIPAAKADKDQIALAKELIKKKSSNFDPKKFKDHYHEALQELINAKLEHRKPAKPGKSQPTAKVVNLMEALKASVKQSGKPASRRNATTKTPVRRKKTSRK